MTDNIKQDGKKKENRIVIFDTTLRDGEQASGFHMFPSEKLEIARQLARLNVDVIEAGFAVSSPGDFKSVYDIAEQVGTKESPIICSLARTVDIDIETATRALEPAYKKRIHTFIATSDIHINGKFKKNREWVMEQAVKAVEKARSYVDDVEFSTEDFGRSDLEYIVNVVSEVIKAGAGTINLPDTVGWLLPHESYEKVKYVIDKVREKGLDAVFSVHNHNDFGLATATTIEAVRAGARQVEVTVNGIGERAGNTSLEEIVALLKTKSLGYCDINTKLIGETSKLVSRITGVAPTPNKAVVGRNAFAHEAGIHQDGVIKEKETYETMDPSDYGVESIITFGPRSGRKALRAKYDSLNIKLNKEEFEKAAEIFTVIADELKEIDDADIIRAVAIEDIPKHYELVSYHPMTDGNYGSIVKLRINGEIKTEYAEGNGQIDASINAVKRIIRENYDLRDFKVTSRGEGSDAVGLTRLKVGKDKWEVIGKGENTDVVRSSIEAFIDGCNRLRYIESYFKIPKILK